MAEMEENLQILLLDVCNARLYWICAAVETFFVWLLVQGDFPSASQLEIKIYRKIPRHAFQCL